MGSSSWLLMFFLLLLILIHDAQGLRLFGKGSVPSTGLHTRHEEKFEGVRRNEGGVEEWKSKKLPGSSRKLITTIHISTNISKNEKKQEEVKEENMSIDSSSETQPADPDILDIAAMDYTLARRKPPIHN